MKFEYVLIDKLPKLAWIAYLGMSESRTIVYHGSDVETHETFFVEGVWDKEFSKGEFSSTDCFFGSGACLHQAGVRFVSSTATTDYLYYRNSGKQLHISNSLPLLLSAMDDRLNPQFPHYCKINETIKDGINRYNKYLPTRKGKVIRLMHYNLEVGADGVCHYSKEDPPSFSSYEEYADYLRDNIGRLLSNARDTHRKKPMKVFSTQSRGYDTTAVNAIAHRFGVDHVFTSSQSKEIGRWSTGQSSPNDEDDGKIICDILGVKCTCIDRRLYEKQFDTELLYHAGLHNNFDTNLLQINEYITEPTLLLTGVLGEIWYPFECVIPDKKHRLDENLQRGDLAGHGLSEVRLHIGFIHTPIPYIGGRRRPDILSISGSPEMKRWRVGGKYDRPIARRIAEEAGIPRELFGQKKLASIVTFPIPNIPCNKELREEFIDFVKSNKLRSAFSLLLLPLVHRINGTIFFNKNFFLRNLRKVYYVLTGKPLTIPLLWEDLDSSLYCFSVNKCAENYSSLMNGMKHAPKE